MPSIHDVAKEAGVSTATVSRTFSAPDLLSHATRSRVLETAKRLNYLPRRSRAGEIRLARGQRTSTHATHQAVGFQFFAVNPTDSIQANSFYGPVLAGAQAEAAALGMHLLLHTTHQRQLLLELPKMVREKAVAGMLLVGTADPRILDLFTAHVPQIVLVDNRDAAQQHDCILSDGFGGVLAATRYLFELGHRRIGFLQGAPDAVSFQDRLRGYQCAHFEAGYAIDPCFTNTVETEEDVLPCLRALMSSPNRPTALLTANDQYAISVIQACRALEIAIPGDLSLIGFDDIEFSAQTYPPLTTLRVNKEHFGRLAVRRLYRRLQGDGLSVLEEPPVHTTVPVVLVRRQSCRKLSSSD